MWRQRAAQLNTLFTGRGREARLLKWGNRKPTHTAARSIKIQKRETAIRFILPCLNFGAALSKQGEKNELPILNFGREKKKKVTEKDFIFSNDWIQMNSQCKKENVFSLKRPRQEGRNKHAPHASFCYSSLSFGLKMEHLWRNSTSVRDL